MTRSPLTPTPEAATTARHLRIAATVVAAIAIAAGAVAISHATARSWPWTFPFATLAVYSGILARILHVRSDRIAEHGLTPSGRLR